MLIEWSRTALGDLHEMCQQFPNENTVQAHMRVHALFGTIKKIERDSAKGMLGRMDMPQERTFTISPFLLTCRVEVGRMLILRILPEYGQWLETVH